MKNQLLALLGAASLTTAAPLAEAADLGTAVQSESPAAFAKSLERSPFGTEAERALQALHDHITLAKNDREPQGKALGHAKKSATQEAETAAETDPYAEGGIYGPVNGQPYGTGMTGVSTTDGTPCCANPSTGVTSNGTGETYDLDVHSAVQGAEATEPY